MWRSDESLAAARSAPSHSAYFGHVARLSSTKDFHRIKTWAFNSLGHGTPLVRNTSRLNLSSSVNGGFLFSTMFARLPASTAAHQALKLQVNLSLNIFPCSVDWKRHPGRPHGRWVDQLRQDYHSPADLWRSSVSRGHS